MPLSRIQDTHFFLVRLPRQDGRRLPCPRRSAAAVASFASFERQRLVGKVGSTSACLQGLTSASLQLPHSMASRFVREVDGGTIRVIDVSSIRLWIRLRGRTLAGRFPVGQQGTASRVPRGGRVAGYLAEWPAASSRDRFALPLFPLLDHRLASRRLYLCP